MKLEICKDLEIDSITLNRDRKGKHLHLHTTDGQHFDLGTVGKAFTRKNFTTVMAEHDITPYTRAGLLQWDAFCISMMQKAKHGGGH